MLPVVSTNPRLRASASLCRRQSVKGGSSRAAFASPSEAEASALTKQMGAAIAYLHSQGVVHRDLKPENLLLTRDAGANADNTTADDTVKICDFGLSVALGRNGTLSEKQGTWAYWAPEMFAPVGTYGKQVDMWSLGVILYIILSGRHPFERPADAETT